MKQQKTGMTVWHLILIQYVQQKVFSVNEIISIYKAELNSDAVKGETFHAERNKDLLTVAIMQCGRQ